LLPTRARPFGASFARSARSATEESSARIPSATAAVSAISWFGSARNFAILG